MRVLIAEDDPNLLAGLSELLFGEGFDCDTAEDGGQALALFQSERHPLVVLDVVLPGQDGLSLCRTIRAEAPETQIMMLSARGEEQDRVLGLEFGADDYLAKPFSPRELVARLKAMARRCSLRETTAAISEGVFVMGDLTIEPGRLAARRGQQEIPLTLREVEVLHFFHRNAGRALSRDEIFDACWGRDHYANSRALDQYISSLRRKIERDSGHPEIIGTIRGVGYRYDPPS